MFYLVLAAGGVAGGLVNAIIAPALLDAVLEYPLMLIVALLLIPGGAGQQDPVARQRALLVDPVVPMAYLAVLVAGLSHSCRSMAMREMPGQASSPSRAYPRRSTAPVRALSRPHPGAGLCPDTDALFSDRTFFGVNRVLDDGAGRHMYVSGVTIHGAQDMSPGGGCQPLSYHHPTGPTGELFAHFDQAEADTDDIAIIGLGAGGLAAYNQAAQEFTFYEIDPAVIRIAQDPALFTFLAGAPGIISIVEGGGRLALAESPTGDFDVIVLDAFESCLDKLHPDGILLATTSPTAISMSRRSLPAPPEPLVLRASCAAIATWRRYPPGTRMPHRG